MKLYLLQLLDRVRIECLFFAEGITKRPRYYPEFDWGNKSVVHKVFRSFEFFFGKDADGQAYSSVSVQEIEPGIVIVHRRFFCVEAVLAEIETKIREALGAFIPETTPQRRPVIAFATLAFLGFVIKFKEGSIFIPMFFGAIAYSTSGSSSQSSDTTLTYSVTTSGSDRLMFTSSYGGANGTDISGKTYSGASMTFLGKVQYPANTSYCHVYYKTAPATGANNVVVSYSPNARMGSVTTVYTGAAQSSPIDNWTTKTQGNNNVISQAITVTASNCWGYAAEEGSNLTYASVSGNNAITTMRGGFDDFICVGDSNGTISTGSITMGFTGSSNHRGILVLAFKLAVTVTSTTVTKSLQYAVKTTPSTITKALIYMVRPAVTITKSLKYCVVITASTIQKALIYAVKITPSTITKSLQYTVKYSLDPIQKTLVYAVKVAPTITKSLKYCVTITATTIQKSLKYSVWVASTIQKSLKYAIITTPATITKQLIYYVKVNPSITKSLQYCVKASTTVTKSLKYTVYISVSAIQKSLKYCVKTSSTLTKQLIYAIKTTSSAITKSLSYRIQIPKTITKALVYSVLVSTSITKSLKYSIRIAGNTITKSLTYRIGTITTTAITKTLRYAVAVPHAITKQLMYQIRRFPYVNKVIRPFTKKDTPYTKKNPPYSKW